MKNEVIMCLVLVVLWISAIVFGWVIPNIIFIAIAIVFNAKSVVEAVTDVIYSVHIWFIMRKIKS